MYKPTDVERDICISVIKDMVEIQNDLEIEQYMIEIFKVAYSIGGDYGENTLRSIAEVLLSRK